MLDINTDNQFDNKISVFDKNNSKNTKAPLLDQRSSTPHRYYKYD